MMSSRALPLLATALATCAAGTVNFLGKMEQVHPERETPGPVKPPPPIVPPAATTMVLASGYRDGERCGKTLAHALKQATHPERVYFGVVDQVGPGDVPCIDWFCKLQKLQHNGECKYRDHVQVKQMPYTEARGPVYARSFQTAMIGNQDFCLQIDAHSQFEKGWDQGLQKGWALAGNEYAVLSTYIHDIGALGMPWARTNVPHVCLSQWGGYGVVRNSQAAGADNLSRPKLNWAWCAGLSYMKCHGELAVPNDPELKQVFDGEEFSRAARLWTRGYDMYTPHTNYVYHDYFKKMGATNKAVWNYEPPPEAAEQRQKEEQHSMKRLWTLFGMDGADGQDLGGYGLGTVRKIEQFYHFSGIDPRGPPGQKKATRGQACGDLVWVPWSGKVATPGRPRQRAAAAAQTTESGSGVRAGVGAGMGLVNGAGAGSRGETGATQAEVAREQQVQQQHQEDEKKREALLRQQLHELEEKRRQQQQVLQQQEHQQQQPQLQQKFDAAAAADAAAAEAAAKAALHHSGPGQKDARFARQAQEDLDSMLQAGGPRAVASARGDSVEALLLFAVGLAVLAMIMQKLLRRRGRGRGGRADRLAALRRKLED